MFSLLLTTLLILLPVQNLPVSNFLGDIMGQAIDESSKQSYSLGPELTASSALIVDAQTGQLLYSKSPNQILPIASLTKLMSAVVFLRHQHPAWDEAVAIQEGDLIQNINNTDQDDDLKPSSLPLRKGDQLSLKEIFTASLVKSANDAVQILSRITESENLSGQQTTFVDLMNQTALDIGMRDSYFIDPTGLNPQNLSTAHDLNKLLLTALDYPEIKQALGLSEYTLIIQRNDGSKLAYQIKNTNGLLNTFINLIAGKTGYLEESDYCFIGLAKPGRKEMIVIILGARSRAESFQEAKSLLWWTQQQTENVLE